MTAVTAVASPPRVRIGGFSLRERGTGATVLIAAVATAFAVVLLSATAFLSASISATPHVGESRTFAVVSGILTSLLVGVAVYVASIVTANTFATVVAGRVRQIALLRLLGSTARSQRRDVARLGLVAGIVGAVAGLVGGTVLSFAGVWVLENAYGIAAPGLELIRPVLLVPAAVVALTTWAGAWAGSRRVLRVTPMAALGQAVEASTQELSRSHGRTVAALVLGASGVGLLALGVVVGLSSPYGVLIAFPGGLLSFTALALGAHLVMPPVLRLIGRLFGRSAVARLAAENALRHPERSSRMAIALVMGVALVMMFAVAGSSAIGVLVASAGGEAPPEMTAGFTGFTTVMMALVAVCGVIAAIGVVDQLALGVHQRRREFALLRALGLSSRQVRLVVLLEAVHLVLASLVVGIVLGTAYGWAGAQAVLGSVKLTPDAAATLVWPVIPPIPLIVVIAATVVVALVATVVPTRIATRTSPVAALAQD